MLEFFNLFVLIIKHSKNSNNQRLIPTFRSGYYYQLNQSAVTEADYAGQNNGTLYPSLLFALDVSATQGNNGSRLITERVHLVLSDLMTTDNIGNNRTRTEMEVRADLMDVWQRILLEYQHVAKQAELRDFVSSFPKIVSNFQYTFGFNENQDRLLNMYIEFDIQYEIPCTIQPNFDYDAAKADATLPFPVLARFDYNNPTYPNDRNPPV